MGMVNSTTTTTGTLAPVTTSTPSANYIRVNVLWFASLMISLIAASFAIFVKQWLREYLTVQNPSPQARLRVRHLRYPQLALWKVFEIAAVLPLLLQLSLGLFFVGMCYFTSEIHSSIVHTTVPLVVGWAACFLSVTLLPFVFPRCPYRTPLLKGIVYSWHRRFFRNMDDSENEHTQGTLFRHRARVAVINVWRQFSCLCADPQQQISRARSAVGNTWNQFSRLYARWREHVQCSDEAEAAASSGADIDILASVDTIQSNDELFATTVLEVVKQIRPDAGQLQRFIFSALKSRIQLPESAWTDALPVMYLSSLAAAPRAAMIELIVQHLESDSLWLGSGCSNRTAFIAVLMYLCAGWVGQPLPKTGVQFLRRLLHEDGENTCRALVEAAGASGDLNLKVKHILEIMWWLTFEIGDDLSACVSNVRTILDTYAWYVRRDGDAFTIAKERMDPPSDLSRYPFDYVSDDCRETASKHLLDSLQATFKHWLSNAPPQLSTVHDTLTLSLQLSYRPATGLTYAIFPLRGVFEEAWSNIESTRCSVSFIAGLPLKHICDKTFRFCLTQSTRTVPLFLIKHSTHTAIRVYVPTGSQQLR